MRIQYSILFVSDMQRAVAFYRDVLGLPLRFESPHWTEFATEGASLALHLADQTATPLPPTAAPQCRPGFQVADLDAFHARMLEHEVRCLDEPREVYGSRVALYADPDGLPFGVSAPAPSA